MSALYFDNAATTQLREEVVLAMVDVMKSQYGNASSTHSFGRSSKVLIEKARKTIAHFLNVSAGEIVFTSGGTEGNNLILRSAVRDLGIKHIISSKIEHHAVLHTLQQLEIEYDLQVSYIDLNEFGDVNYSHLETLLQNDTKTLVSLMLVNNEVGNILDAKKVSDLCKKHSALFHTDAVQYIGHYKIDLQDTNIDFLTASAHKFHGPKGVGFTYIRKNSGLKPLIFGGEQERGLRGGTESIHNIVGLETAFKLFYDNFDSEHNYLKSIKKYFIEQLKKHIPDVSFNGFSEDLNKSVYTILNIRLPIPQEKTSMLLFQLDLKGIACSKGSACQSGSNKNSHVLAEISSTENLKNASIRFSVSIYNTKTEIDSLICILATFLNA